LNELENEKFIYFFKEKVITNKQTTGESSETRYDTRRTYANKKSKDNGGIDLIYFSHDTLCFKVNEYIVGYNSYTDPKPPKGGTFEAKTIGYAPIEFAGLNYEHKENTSSNNINDSREYIDFSDLQILYSPCNFGYKTGKIEERVSCAKAFYHLLVSYKMIVEQQLYDDAIEKFKTVLSNYYKKQAEKPTISEEQRKLIVQANVANDDKKYDSALDLYRKAIKIDEFSYTQAYYNMALIAEAENDFQYAIFSMKKYLLLVPDASDACVAQDKIYAWEYKLTQ